MKKENKTKRKNLIKNFHSHPSLSCLHFFLRLTTVFYLPIIFFLIIVLCMTPIFNCTPFITLHFGRASLHQKINNRQTNKQTNK